MSETIVITRPGPSSGLDRHGRPLPGTSTSRTVHGCLFEPGASAEPVAVDRAAVRTAATVYAPAGTDVAAGDTVQARGRTWQVAGDPAVWESAAGPRGVVVDLLEVAG